MTTPVSPKVIDRLKALLALAEGKGATEAEAQLAMEHAQALMLKHSLTVATVEASGGTKEARLKDQTSKNLMFKWQRQLFEVVAKVNFCHFSLVYKRTASGEEIAGGYEIIGRQSNVIAARNMYEYLAQTIARLVKQECGTSSSAQFTKYANSFRLGCVDRLSDRLRERHEAKVEEESRTAREQNTAARHPSATTVNALVVIASDYQQTERDLNNDLLNGWAPGTTQQRREEQDRDYQQRQAERAAKLADLMAEGIAKEIADWMSYGYSQEAATKLANPPPAKPETEAQARKREAKEAREEARRVARWAREGRKIDSAGYYAGQRSGEGVGLDDQITKSETRKLR